MQSIPAYTIYGDLSSLGPFEGYNVSRINGLWLDGFLIEDLRESILQVFHEFEVLFVEDLDELVEAGDRIREVAQLLLDFPVHCA